jgi:hypothetical protein
MLMQATQSGADLQAAFSEPGCSICSLLGRDERRYFEALLYEQVNDPGIRDALRATRGFCAAHAHALAATPNAPFGSAIISQDLLQTILANLPARITGEPAGAWAALRSAFGNGPDRISTAGALRGAGSCPACRHFNEFARMYAEILVTGLEQEAAHAAYSRSAGVCLPHLLLALEYSTSETGLDRLLAHQLEAWRELVEDLAEFIRKHDYRFHAEGLDPRQRDVWRRALNALSGLRRGHDEFDSRA